MTIIQETFSSNTNSRKAYEITAEVQKLVANSDIQNGLCHLFIQHTSASLMLCENADPDVRTDLETFMQSIVPDGDPMFCHTTEGVDDMPAHVRTLITNVSLTIPIASSCCQLGAWQGIYLWEHRTSSHNRKVIVTLHGD
ncbi:MAG: YjbQ family protein [Proteobacteria bacterium]|nr:YjbQ family protein [Pseudomonadota bacterium]NOG61043.1 YjbQ family protein [Pseudomonadota bacterium]